ncbi:Hypothetical protein NTJ_05183 [Nesidiocoris tenuis]|uniref:Uncharacterized protein n=1 Tax=Nesidiocoris tenuis TaxID=355587 RepID=A0ABN7ALS0_9HEMI|nr:Hypothetical protein NTJ_05183 [Nesidiocoris tenuis]
MRTCDSLLPGPSYLHGPGRARAGAQSNVNPAEASTASTPPSSTPSTASTPPTPPPHPPPPPPPLPLSPPPPSTASTASPLYRLHRYRKHEPPPPRPDTAAGKSGVGRSFQQNSVAFLETYHPLSNKGLSRW